ncbi:MAG: hypothetical protein ABEK36_04480 [Candidatus Aenigmatarchaeota archaeon]
MKDCLIKGRHWHNWYGTEREIIFKRGSFCLTIPSTFVRSNNIKKGSSLYLQAKENQVLNKKNIILMKGDPESLSPTLFRKKALKLGNSLCFTVPLIVRKRWKIKSNDKFIVNFDTLYSIEYVYKKEEEVK